MVIKEVSLETVCGITSTIPDNQLPEIAFAGKSNVGKSSLINALIVAVGVRNKERTFQTFRALESIWKEYEVYKTIES